VLAFMKRKKKKNACYGKKPTTIKKKQTNSALYPEAKTIDLTNKNACANVHYGLTLTTIRLKLTFCAKIKRVRADSSIRKPAHASVGSG